MAIEMPKSGIDAVGDMVSWRGHFCLFYETRKEAHLPGEQENRCWNPVDEETRFSSLESSSSLERLNQLYGRRGH